MLKWCFQVVGYYQFFVRYTNVYFLSKMTPPLISAIIPTYNHGNYIGRSISSVLSQTLTDYEVIVVDDGSTDDTLERLRVFGDNVRYHRQEYRGLGSARNAGLALAKGKYVQLLDADDSIAPEKFEMQVPVLTADESISVVYSDYANLDSNQKIFGGEVVNFVGGDGREEVLHGVDRRLALADGGAALDRLHLRQSGGDLRPALQVDAPEPDPLPGGRRQERRFRRGPRVHPGARHLHRGGDRAPGAHPLGCFGYTSASRSSTIFTSRLKAAAAWSWSRWGRAGYPDTLAPAATLPQTPAWAAIRAARPTVK